MQGISKRRGTLALTASIILIMLVAAGAVYLYGSNFISNGAPQVQVASVDDGDVLPAGAIEIKGAAADDGTVRAVSIRVNGGSPLPVVPTANDFSSWSIVLDLGPGNHTIEIETVDDSGRTNSKEISVVAIDAALDMPADIVVEAAGPSGATVDYTLPTVQEGIKISDGPDCLPEPGSMFPLGTTTVACSVSFAGGTTASDFQVSVVDITPPTIKAPPDITVENSGVAFMELSLVKPDFDDNVDASPTVSNNAPANGFALGTTLVVWTAEDDHGNVATAAQKVTVTAVIDPEIEENDEDGGSVTYAGGGGGGGGSSNSSQDDSEDVDEDEGSGGASAPPQHTLTIDAEDLSGEPISVSVTVKATNGTILQTGSTPQTFVGTNLTYEITVADYDDTRFDHWENGAASLTRQLALSQDATIVAYYNTSDTASDTIAPTVTATPAGGTYSPTQSVTLAASEPATIYYTTNGNNPTTSSSVYSSPISITSNITLKYFAKDTAGNSGSIATQTYTINTADTTDPTVEITNFDDGSAVAMPAGGLITVLGTASDNEGGSGIEVVEVRVDDGSYVEATPAAEGDWSSWSVTLEVTAGERRLVPRVTDNAGNQAWNSIYVTFTEYSDGGGGGGDTLDDFGIEKIYSTKSGGNEWYVDMDDPYSDPLLQNRETLTKQPDGSWQVSGGSNGQVRLEAWSPANEKWLNVEITMYAKMVSGSNELLQMYSRGGHHTSSNECLGSAYKARFYGDGEARWVKEVNHPAYTSNRGSMQATNTPLADRWVGLKAVIYNFVEDGKTYIRMESYIDDDVTNSDGNLVIDNGWELASVVEDRGGWSTSDSDFNGTCTPVDVDSTEQYRQRDEILSMPGGTATQNIAAFRSDGLTWNWKYLTVREIVPPS